jgi:hypothetical protein
MLDAGGHATIDYKRESVAERVRSLTDGRGADALIDMNFSTTAPLLAGAPGSDRRSVGTAACRSLATYSCRALEPEGHRGRAQGPCPQKLGTSGSCGLDASAFCTSENRSPK